MKRIFIAIAGGTVVAIGIVMILLPGPGVLVILAGLGVLAIEFAWARRLLKKARECLPGKNSGQAKIPGQPPLPNSTVNSPVE